MDFLLSLIDFPIVNFPFLDSDIPLAPSYGVYISQLVRFCRICTKDPIKTNVIFI